MIWQQILSGIKRVSYFKRNRIEEEQFISSVYLPNPSVTGGMGHKVSF